MNETSMAVPGRDPVMPPEPKPEAKMRWSWMKIGVTVWTVGVLSFLGGLVYSGRVYSEHDRTQHPCVQNVECTHHVIPPVVMTCRRGRFDKCVEHGNNAATCEVIARDLCNDGSYTEAP